MGIAGINLPIPIPLSFHGFGGWKGWILGSHGIDWPDAPFPRGQKVVITRWPDPLHPGVDLASPCGGS